MSDGCSNTVWLIADTHFGQQPKPRLRATGMTAAAMDAALVAAWHRCVGAHDIVWHLGDVGDFGFLPSLPGVKHLVWGNCESRQRGIDSEAFERVEKRVVLDGIELVHDPRDARTTGPVFHGHLHHLHDGRAGFVCLSVDQTNFAPIHLTEAKSRLPATGAA